VFLDLTARNHGFQPGPDSSVVRVADAALREIWFKTVLKEIVLVHLYYLELVT
jgi:hypothetical protein